VPFNSVSLSYVGVSITMSHAQCVAICSSDATANRNALGVLADAAIYNLHERLVLLMRASIANMRTCTPRYICGAY
jgi:hypothetical protein